MNKINKNLNKGFIIPVIIIVALLLIGVGIYSYSVNQQTSQTNVSGDSTSIPGRTIIKGGTSSDYTPPAATESGIEGLVTIGPTCPGPTRPGCEDKPYSTTFTLYSKAGPGDGAEKLAATFHSDTNGKFTINVAPGTYEIRQASNSELPRMSPQAVVVKANTFTHVDIQFDSGIR